MPFLSAEEKCSCLMCIGSCVFICVRKIKHGLAAAVSPDRMGGLTVDKCCGRGGKAA